MPLWKLILNIFVILVAIVCAMGVWETGTWEKHFRALVFGFVGLTAYFFPDEWSSYSGRRGWRMNQWRFAPVDWTHIMGFIIFVISAIAILR